MNAKRRAMSPAGGVGINLAVADAVAAGGAGLADELGDRPQARTLAERGLEAARRAHNDHAESELSSLLAGFG